MLFPGRSVSSAAEHMLNFPPSRTGCATQLNPGLQSQYQNRGTSNSRTTHEKYSPSSLQESRSAANWRVPKVPVAHDGMCWRSNARPPVHRPVSTIPNRDQYVSSQTMDFGPPASETLQVRNTFYPYSWYQSTKSDSQCFKCGYQLFNLGRDTAIGRCDKGGVHFIDDLELWSLPDAPPRLPCVALDCEMVCTTRGHELAHIVILHGITGEKLKAQYVRPKGEILDLLTPFSGITEADSLLNANAIDLEQLPAALTSLGMTRRTYILGHGLESDFKAMRLKHETHVVDTALLYPRVDGRRQKLKRLAWDYLGLEMQKGNHDPDEDARTAMRLVHAYNLTRCLPFYATPFQVNAW